MSEVAHISVMPVEVMELLDLKSGAIAFDGTVGMGGHSLLMAQKVGAGGRLIGCDRDGQSLKVAQQRLNNTPAQVDLVQGNFKDIQSILSSLNVTGVDAVVLDLGISSFQLDDPTRGFAFKAEGPLDMRMDQTQGQSAADFLNSATRDEIAKVIFEYGEERFSRRIADAVVERRSSQKIKTTQELADLILRALPKGYQRGRIHPATRTFQALRILVNDELGILADALKSCFKSLNIEGRMCVIAFHSLEDRIVKNTFKELAHSAEGKILTKKPLEAGEGECVNNPRARSAKLRAIQRTL